MMEILPLLVIRINLMKTLEGTKALFCVLELELYYNLYICYFR